MGTGKKKIEMKKITKNQARFVTFSKRRQGLFKKADQLSSNTGSQIAVVVFSPTGKIYSYGDPSSLVDRLSDIKNDVEECNNVEELMVLKKELEETREKLLEKIASE